MHPPGQASSAPAALLSDVVARQPLLAAINLGLGTTLAATFAPVVGHRPAWGWLAMMGLTQLARLALWLWADAIPALAARTELWLTSASAAAGMTWGAAGVLFFVVEPPAYQIFLPFVLGGMAAGAVAALPGHPPSFFAFYLPTLSPYAARLLMEPGGVHRLMGVITIAFAAGIGIIGLQLARLFGNSARLHLENASLVDTLAEARQALERDVAERTRELRAANRRLVGEVAQRRASESRVRHLLHHDTLTGLPNRLLLQDRLRQALAHARRSDERMVLMLLDLDGFKEINDTRGHPAGDRLLKAVAARLATRVRSADTLARLGGDEFAIVQVGVTSVESGLVLADELVACMARPLLLDGEEVVRGISIGVAVFPDHGRDLDTLLTHADIALYAAKQHRQCRRLFSAEMGEETRNRRQLDTDLRQAIEAEQFVLHYQPRYELGAGAMTGVEALVRWRHPTRGLLAPGSFIPRAESTGLIRPLGRWVLEAACRQAADWQRRGRRLRVSVNLSPAQFREQNVASLVDEALSAAGLDAAALELEITETLYLEFASDAVYGALRDLRLMGVQLAIDDFGTGYSSLAYLRHLPFDLIKIDRAFVRHLGSDAEDEAIVHAVVTLVHNLGKRVVAEGVETPRQLALLRHLGCDEAQGFLLARPCPATEVRVASRLDVAAGGVVEPSALQSAEDRVAHDRQHL
jgi:diguanylate cyclase (GGDEF)-like protein